MDVTPPSSRRSEDESLIKIAARRAVRRMQQPRFGPDLSRLLRYQALGAGGDALLALALSTTLFFSVPEATARGRVALYLALTVAPFAVVSPLLAKVLDRHRGSLRWAMVAAAGGRATLAWLLATRIETWLLFPLAFGVLILSRAALIVRGAVLPVVLRAGESLVTSNAALSKVAAIAGMIAGVPGLILLRWVGVEAVLLLAAGVYYVGMVPALRTPLALRSPEGDRERSEVASGAWTAAGDLASPPGPGRWRRRGRGTGAGDSAGRHPGIERAIVATAGMRLLVGFLVFHLAFALRRSDLGAVGLGLLVGSAAFGALAGALLAPRLRKSLKEEGIIVASLIGAGVTALLVGRWFTPVSSGALVFAFGVASGSAKVAFDAIVQRETPAGGRGRAFARSESILQLAWVAGALVPLVFEIPGAGGMVAVGLLANLIAIAYTLARPRPPSRS